MDTDKSSRWNFSSDEDAETPSTDIFPKSPDFFQSLMADRLASMGSTENIPKDKLESEDDEDDELSPPKKKPVFSAIFKAAAPDTKQSNPSEKIETESYEEPVQSSEASIETTPQPNNEEWVDSANQAELVPNTEIRETSEPEIDTPDPVERELATEDVIKIEHEHSAPIDEAKDDKHDLPRTPNRQNAVDQNYIRSAQPETTKETGVTATPTKREVGQQSSERGGGALLAFLGAEFLSRRRDRKLSKEIKTKEKIAHDKIEHLKKSQLTQKEAQETLRIHQQKQIDKIAAAQAESRRFTAASEPNNSTRVEAFNAENKTASNFRTQPEKIGASQTLQVSSETEQEEPFSPRDRNVKYDPSFSGQEKYFENIPPVPKIERHLSNPELNTAEELILPSATDQEVLVRSTSRQRKAAHFNTRSRDSASGNYSGIGDSTKRTVTPANVDPGSPVVHSQGTVQPSYKQAIGFGAGAAILILLATIIYYYLA